MKTLTELFNEANNAEPWDDVHKRLIDKRFFSCKEDYEPEALIKKLKAKYKGAHSAEQISEKIEEVCQERGKKIGMDYFVEHVLIKLGEK